jgi:hypothetical protein
MLPNHQPDKLVEPQKYQRAKASKTVERLTSSSCDRTEQKLSTTIGHRAWNYGSKSTNLTIQYLLINIYIYMYI